MKDGDHVPLPVRIEQSHMKGDHTEIVSATIHCAAEVADEIRDRLREAVQEILANYDAEPDTGDLIDWGVR